MELRIAPEAGFESGCERSDAPAAAVDSLELLKSLLVAEPTDRHARLRLEQPTQVRGAQSRAPCQGREVACRRVGSQCPSDFLDCGMKIGASDDVLAVEKRAPGEDEQVRQSSIDEDVVHCFRIAHFPEKNSQARDQERVKTA